MTDLKEIRERHDEYEAILVQMRIDYADKNHKPIELLTNKTHKDRGELLKMVDELQAQLTAGCEDMDDEFPRRTCGLADKYDKRIEQLQAKLAMYEDYNNMDGEGDWKPPHPIFLIAEENDTLKAQLEAYKKFAERVCRGDIGNTIMFEKMLKALNGENSE